jgi:hypothetical protein
MDVSVVMVSLIATICGFLGGTIESPGFGMIVPLFPSFSTALGVYYMVIIVPSIINGIVFMVNIINFKLNIIFTIIFGTFSRLSVYFSKYIKDHYKFYIASLVQLIISVWYFTNADK